MRRRRHGCWLAQRDRPARRACGGLRVAGRRSRPSGTLGARQVPLGARHRKAQQEALARVARVLPAVDGQLSAEPVPRRREARPGRHVSRRGIGRIRRARDQRVPRVPLVLPDARARRLRAVQARHVALLPDARRRCAIRPRRATRSASCRRFVHALPERAADRRGAQKRLREAQGSPGRLRTTASPTSTSGSKWYPGRDRSLQDHCSRRIRNTPAATRVYFYLARVVDEDAAAGRSAPLLRSPRGGIRAERVPRRRPRSWPRPQGGSSTKAKDGSM